MFLLVVVCWCRRVDVPDPQRGVKWWHGGIRRNSRRDHRDGTPNHRRTAHICSKKQRLQLRELDARELASRAAALSSAELQSMRARHKAELARKNAQIDTFRAEIDAITSELVQLHEQQAEAVCVVHRK